MPPVTPNAFQAHTSANLERPVSQHSSGDSAASSVDSHLPGDSFAPPSAEAGGESQSFLTIFKKLSLFKDSIWESSNERASIMAYDSSQDQTITSASGPSHTGGGDVYGVQGSQNNNTGPGSQFNNTGQGTQTNMNFGAYNRGVQIGSVIHGTVNTNFYNALERQPEEFSTNNIQHDETFVGRNSELDQLDNHFKEHSMGVIHGLGGVGKTSLAKLYAQRNEEQYPIAWRINAENERSTSQDLVALGKRLMKNNAFGADKDEKEAAEHVLRVLKNTDHDKALLILDNLEENDETHRAFHDIPNTHILITTRHSNWGERYAQVALEPFDESNGVTYFTHDADDKKRSFEVDEAKSLTQVVDGLPLAMQQAKLYLREAERTNVADYVAEVETLIKEYVPPRGEQRLKSEENEHLVLAVLQKSLNQIARRSPSSAAIATFAAFFGAEKIPLRLFRQSPATYRADLQPVLGDKKSLNLRSALENPRFLEQGIGALSNFSIIKDSREGDTVSMHRVMQMALRDSLGSSSIGWNEAALEVAASILTPIPTWDDRRIDVASHAEAALEHIASYRPTVPLSEHKIVQDARLVIDRVSAEREIVHVALEAINSLPTAQRAVMMLYYMGQVPLNKIAEKVQLTTEEASNLHRDALSAVTEYVNRSSENRKNRMLNRENSYSLSEHIEAYLNTEELEEKLSQIGRELFEQIRHLPWPQKDVMLMLRDEKYREITVNKLNIKEKVAVQRNPESENPLEQHLLPQFESARFRRDENDRLVGLGRRIPERERLHHKFFPENFKDQAADMLNERLQEKEKVVVQRDQESEDPLDQHLLPEWSRVQLRRAGDNTLLGLGQRVLETQRLHHEFFPENFRDQAADMLNERLQEKDVYCVTAEILNTTEGRIREIQQEAELALSQ